MAKITLIVGRDENEQKSYEWFIAAWRSVLLKLVPDLIIEVYPTIKNAAEVEFACVWKHPIGCLNKFPNLKCIASLAAGVDHILSDTSLPKDVPIVRVMDPYMADDIVQYVTAYVLNYIKRVDHWAEKQQQQIWFKQPPFSFADKQIGIMGLGFLGSKAAHILQALGLSVLGWSNSTKSLPGVRCYHGQEQFATFLSQAHVLVCMLPLTPFTKNILNANTFLQLPFGAYVINVGRGEHLVENDLLDALQSGHVAQACLDVFIEEPLPPSHPFWTNKHIRVTPHIASVTNAETAAPQIVDNFNRMQSGLPFINVIDRDKGY